MNGRVTVWRSRRNPLVRGSDLAEAWVALALGALAFAGAPAAGVASAAAFEDSLLDQGQERHAASAVMLESPKRPPAVHPELPEAPPQAVVRWIASDGTPRSGRVVVAAGLTAGSTVTVWLDALLTNPDRTARNTNLLIWERSPWLIDHGAALYAHHDWKSVDDARTRSAFPLIRDHVLLTQADDVATLDEELAALLPPRVIDEVVAALPDGLLDDAAFQADGDTPAAARDRYRAYLGARLAAPRAFAETAGRMRTERMEDVPVRRTARR